MQSARLSLALFSPVKPPRVLFIHEKSRFLLWSSVVLIGATGVGLYFFAPARETALPHPLNGLFRELHGLASFFAIFMFGYFFSDHVKKKLVKHRQSKTRRPWDGYVHLVVWGVLLVSGLLLYYPQTLIEFSPLSVAHVHWYVGLILLFLFPLHFWRKVIANKNSYRKGH